MSKRGPVVAGLMLCMALAAMDQTIVATAVPAIVSDLGSFSLFPWVIAGYMLAQAVCTPVAGRLADMYGRKPMLLIGTGVFLVGALLGGLSTSMPMLILARIVQGLGAGALQPIIQVVAADLYPLAERGRITAILSTVWGVSALAGPALGGILSEYASWRWILFLNLPVGGAALLVLTLRLREPAQKRAEHRLDVLGMVLLILGVGSIMLGLQLMAYPLIGAGVALLVAFLFWERRAAEPVIPPWVWRDRVLLGSFAGSAVVGMTFVGPTVYLPTFVQGAIGAGAVAAGFALAAQSLGWPLAAGLSSLLYMRIGFRNTGLAGIALMIVSALMFLQADGSSSVLYIGTCSFVGGFGLGLLNVSTLVAGQSVVGWDRRGLATGTVVFSRIAGSAVGTAIFAAVANSTLADRLTGPGVPPGTPASIDEVVEALQGGTGQEFVRQALTDATHNVFLTMIAISLTGLILIFIMPHRFKPADS
ncbi:MFS transporter [Rhizohabitans arisaemae]|uniref:MFS transporter n=1 Tax=Rhizohabitans arisaemae TaxID=2720610 RepID=UPI0024B0C75E|nr:MFS transporter [Rhizohabitans arisaemae]